MAHEHCHTTFNSLGSVAGVHKERYNGSKTFTVAQGRRNLDVIIRREARISGAAPEGLHTHWTENARLAT